MTSSQRDVDGRALRRLTGSSAIAAGAFSLAAYPFYNWDAAPPERNQALTHVLLTLFTLASMVVFMNGIRHLVKRRDQRYEWAGDLAASAGLLWTGIVFVASAIEAGVLIASPGPVDGTIAAPGTYILYGSVSRILVALFLASLAYAARRTGIMPAWVTRVCAGFAVVQLLFVPSLYFGNVTAHFYAANGWGTTATVGGLTVLWMLVMGVVLVRRTPVSTAAGRGALEGAGPGIADRSGWGE